MPVVAAGKTALASPSIVAAWHELGPLSPPNPAKFVPAADENPP